MAKKAATKHNSTLMHAGMIAMEAAAPAHPQQPPPPVFDCGNGWAQLKTQTTQVVGGVTKISRSGSLKRIRMILWCATGRGYDILRATKPSDPFPNPPVDANLRTSLRADINLRYYDDVGCQVSDLDLSNATTPLKFMDMIWSHIPSQHRI
jgi:hypothetical protein